MNMRHLAIDRKIKAKALHDFKVAGRYWPGETSEEYKEHIAKQTAVIRRIAKEILDGGCCIICGREAPLKLFAHLDCIIETH